MRNVSEKFVGKNQYTYFVFSNFFPNVVHLINMEKYVRARQATNDTIICRTRFVCLIPKATDTHSEYVILTAFPQQAVSGRRRNIMLYVHCLSC